MTLRSNACHGENFIAPLIAAQDIKGAEGLSGVDLDNKLVEFEQAQLGYYITGYKSVYMTNHTQQQWDAMITDINANFNGTHTGGKLAEKHLVPNSLKYGINKFREKYGADAKFDFMNKEHRIYLGQKMAEYNRTQKK